MKEFKVYIGLTEDNMTEVLHSGLKNDSIPETFSIRHANNAGVCFPTLYVKIVPLSAHGQSFHTSIWHVSLTGIADQVYVEQVRMRHDEYREVVILKHVLKHLRQRRFLTPYNEILARTGLRLEHSLVTELYDSLVLQGNWSDAEQTVRTAASAELFTDYRHACSPRARWTQLHGLDADGDAPCRRGGHAMCMDEQAGLVYLFGGWDGQRSLDDFWVYDIARDTWRCLSLATSRETNGPGPRACHKMVLDSKTGSIYLLGRLGDGDALEPANIVGAGSRSTSPIPVRLSSSRQTEHVHRLDSSDGSPASTPWTSYCSEFYRYHTRGLDAGKWDLLSFDTASSGGPPLIFDHQMVIDSEAQKIYVSGGRVVDGDWESCKCSGLYAYDIHTGMWEMLQSDASSSYPCISSRWGHSMLLEPTSRVLFIFAGKRGDEYMSDMYAFHIPSGTVTELYSNFTAGGGPAACFTQRAVIDPELKEIYVFCGLTRNRPGLTILETESSNWIYRYDRPDCPGQWVRIVPADFNTREGSDVNGSSPETERPPPRYAHQVVYDSRKKMIFMHGGNSGIVKDASAVSSDGVERAMEEARRGVLEGLDTSREQRLDDFWNMQLERPQPEEMVRRATYQIRQQQFRELCEDAPGVKALAFLQTEVSPVVDHSDADEAHAFRTLLSHLLATPSSVHSMPDTSISDGSPDRRANRSEGGSQPDIHVKEDISNATGEDEEIIASTKSRNATSRSVVGMEEDPVERTLCTEGTSSPVRFKQRMAVFEKLMTYVNEDSKQPDKDLLDLINTDGGDV
ncbi:hypothetical protein AcW1_008781 [Taiwanofungus camphoratus]|nr:hypothetical protein AcW1_008781 [Antrodia cinnamomea]